MIFRLFHEGRSEKLPLFFGLLSLQNMSKVSAFDFGKIDAVANQSFNPILIVLERQIEDEPSRMSHFLLEFIIDQIEYILLIDSVSLSQFRQDKFLNCQ